MMQQMLLGYSVADSIDWGGNRGVFMGGWTNIEVNTIDYIDIKTTGNATDFGDTLVDIEGPACCSNGSRGIGMAGVEQATRFDTIQYITFATTGNSTDFGDCSAQKNACGALSNGTRGVVGGGDAGGNFNVMEYVTIATTGNTTDFGDLTAARIGPSAASSSTRGVFQGGNTDPSYVNTMDFVEIASTGNAIDFGDLTVVRGCAYFSCGSLVRTLPHGSTCGIS